MEKALYREMYERENDYWWFAARRRIVLSLVDRYVKPAHTPRFLDVGCGTGSMLQALEGRGGAVGVDASEEALAFAATRTKAALVKGEVPEVLRSLEGKFDCVLLLDLLEHVGDDRETVRAAAGVLDGGGVMIITVPAHPWLYAPRVAYHHHLRRYRKGEVKQLVAGAGLAEVFTSYYNALFFPVAVAQRLWSRVSGGEPGPDIRPLPRILNGIMEEAFAAERFLLGRMPLPWGLSLVAVARRRPDRCANAS